MSDLFEKSIQTLELPRVLEKLGGWNSATISEDENAKPFRSLSARGRYLAAGLTRPLTVNSIDCPARRRISCT